MIVAVRTAAKRLIVSIGSGHELDVKHPKYEIGLRLIGGWIASTDGYPDDRIMFHEGQHSGFGPTATYSIEHHYGEAGFVQYYAYRSGVRAVSAEPGPEEEIATALAKYGPELTSMFLGAREIPWLGKAGHQPDKYMRYQLGRYSKFGGITYEAFERGFRRQYGDYFLNAICLEKDKHGVIKDCLALTEPSAAARLADNLWLTELAKVAEEVQAARSRCIGRVIIAAAQQGKSVLSWLGRQHLKVFGSDVLLLGEPYDPFEGTT